MSTMLGMESIKIDMINGVQETRRIIEVERKEYMRKVGELEYMKEKKLAVMHEIADKNPADYINLPSYKKYAEEVSAINLEISQEGTRWSDRLSVLRADKKKALNEIVSDNMYYLGYISSIYNIEGCKTFTYKRKEYTLEEFEQGAGILMNTELYMKSVLHKLGFTRVYTADDKPFKRFFKDCITPLMPSPKNGEEIRVLSIDNYKELVVELIVKYLINSGKFIYVEDKSKLEKI